MSLHGKRVVVTRAPHQAATLAALLEAQGAEPILYPCIDIAPVDDATFDTALHDLRDFDWLILTSQNTVIAIQKRLEQQSLSPDWSQIQIAAVGQATADSATALLGAPVNAIPDDQLASALAQMIPIHSQSRILLPQSARADDTLAEDLRQRGAQVTLCTAYDNIVGSGGDDVPDLLALNRIDALTFTSSSTAENFVRRISPYPVPASLPAACIGPRTAATARACGFQVTLVPSDYTLDDMVECLGEYFAD